MNPKNSSFLKMTNEIYYCMNNVLAYMNWFAFEIDAKLYYHSLENPPTSNDFMTSDFIKNRIKKEYYYTQILHCGYFEEYNKVCLLLWLFNHGYFKCVKFLLDEEGYDIEDDSYGYFLNLALGHIFGCIGISGKKDFMFIVKYLIKKDANVNYICSDGYNISSIKYLFLYSMSNYTNYEDDLPELLTLFLENGVDLYDGKGGSTWLNSIINTFYRKEEYNIEKYKIIDKIIPKLLKILITHIQKKLYQKISKLLSPTIESISLSILLEKFFKDEFYPITGPNYPIYPKIELQYHHQYELLTLLKEQQYPHSTP